MEAESRLSSCVDVNFGQTSPRVGRGRLFSGSGSLRGWRRRSVGRWEDELEEKGALVADRTARGIDAGS